MKGYDFRERATKTQKGEWGLADGSGVIRRGRTHMRSERVTSFRDSVGDRPLLSSQVDPYGWLMDNTVAQKRRKAIKDGSFGAQVPPVVDNGHPFSTIKEELQTSIRGINNTWWGSPTLLFRGGPAFAFDAQPEPVQAALMPFKFRSFQSATASRDNFTGRIKEPAGASLADYGKKAINILAPGQPTFDLFAAVGELRYGFPRFPFSSLERVGDSWRKRGADEFLNYVFGIQPTVRDIAELVKTLMSLTSALDQLVRDSGRPVRRKLVNEFPSKTDMFLQGSQLINHGGTRFGSTALTGYDYGSQFVGQYHYPYGATYNSTLDLRSFEKLSFSGSFTYWLPPLPSQGHFSASTWEIANRIIRFNGSLSGLWQITPWSWLLDWYLDISSFIELVERTADDSLVINYGYAMREVFYTATQRTAITVPSTHRMRVEEVATTAILHKKERIRANPYGFINPSSSEMTPMRWAILAAIGINRGTRGGYN